MKRARADSQHLQIEEVMDHINEITNIPIGRNKSLITKIKMNIIQVQEIQNIMIKEIIIKQKKKTSNLFRNITNKKMNTMIKAEIIIITSNIIKVASQNRKVNIIINIILRFHTSQNLKMIIEIKTFINLKDGMDPMCYRPKLKGSCKNKLKYFKKIRLWDNFQECSLILLISIIILMLI